MKIVKKLSLAVILVSIGSALLGSSQDTSDNFLEEGITSRRTAMSDSTRPIRRTSSRIDQDYSIIDIPDFQFDQNIQEDDPDWLFEALVQYVSVFTPKHKRSRAQEEIGEMQEKRISQLIKPLREKFNSENPPMVSPRILGKLESMPCTVSGYSSLIGLLQECQSRSTLQSTPEVVSADIAEIVQPVHTPPPPPMNMPSKNKIVTAIVTDVALSARSSSTRSSKSEPLVTVDTLSALRGGLKKVEPVQSAPQQGSSRIISPSTVSGDMQKGLRKAVSFSTKSSSTSSGASASVAPLKDDQSIFGVLTKAIDTRRTSLSGESRNGSDESEAEWDDNHPSQISQDHTPQLTRHNSFPVPPAAAGAPIVKPQKVPTDSSRKSPEESKASELEERLARRRSMQSATTPSGSTVSAGAGESRPSTPREGTVGYKLPSPPLRAVTTTSSSATASTSDAQRIVTPRNSSHAVVSDDALISEKTDALENSSQRLSPEASSVRAAKDLQQMATPPEGSSRLEISAPHAEADHAVHNADTSLISSGGLSSLSFHGQSLDTTRSAAIPPRSAPHATTTGSTTAPTVAKRPLPKPGISSKERFDQAVSSSSSTLAISSDTILPNSSAKAAGSSAVLPVKPMSGTTSTGPVLLPSSTIQGTAHEPAAPLPTSAIEPAPIDVKLLRKGEPDSKGSEPHKKQRGLQMSKVLAVTSMAALGAWAFKVYYWDRVYQFQGNSASIG